MADRYPNGPIHILLYIHIIFLEIVIFLNENRLTIRNVNYFFVSHQVIFFPIRHHSPQSQLNFGILKRPFWNQ